MTGSLSGTFVDGGDGADRLTGGPNDERLYGGRVPMSCAEGPATTS